MCAWCVSRSSKAAVSRSSPKTCTQLFLSTEKGPTCAESCIREHTDFVGKILRVGCRSGTMMGRGGDDPVRSGYLEETLSALDLCSVYSATFVVQYMGGPKRKSPFRRIRSRRHVRHRTPRKHENAARRRPQSLGLSRLRLRLGEGLWARRAERRRMFSKYDLRSPLPFRPRSMGEG